MPQLVLMNKYKYSYLDDKGIYCYENSDVLINKFGIKDESTFRKTERFYAGIRQYELKRSPLNGKFDFDHLKAIHHYLFQDLFYWAGKTRTVAIAKGNLFCLPQYIDSFAKDLFSNLKNSKYFLNQNKEQLIISITNLLGDLNALHPFREGNGRTQREFVRYIAGINGYGLNWAVVTSEENITASYESVNGNNGKLQSLITRIIYEINAEEKKAFAVFKDTVCNIK